MGSSLGRMLSFFQRNSPVRVLIVGLDAAGKTTMLYQLKLGEVVTTIPTIGFNVETISYRGVDITCWDVSGRDKIRALWRHYFQDTGAIVVVVDSNDRERISQIKFELDQLIVSDELDGRPFLIVANKQDLESAMSVEEITEKLELEKILNRSWHVAPAVAKDGTGLYAGLDWLVTEIAKAKTKTQLIKPVEEAERELDKTRNTVLSWLTSLWSHRKPDIEKNTLEEEPQN